MIETISNLISHNQFLSGGLLLGSIGTIVMYIRSWGLRLVGLGQKLFITHVMVEDKEIIRWINKWVEAKVPPKANIMLLVGYKGNKPYAKVIPGLGTHFLGRYKTSLIWLRHTKEKPQGLGSVEIERYSLTFVGKACVKEFLDEIRDFAVPPDTDYIYVKTVRGDYWATFGSGINKKLDSVVIPSEDLNSIKQDIQLFLNSKKWYKDTGVPYRRGYLLYGDPGNGKSSLIAALASHFKLDIYILRLNQMNAQNLSYLLAIIPPKSIVLMEDVDCMVPTRDQNNEKDDKHKLTFSDVLNVLDGIGASEGHILIMTTNHIEKLDPALIRPGRVDFKLRLNNATQKQAEQLFLKFHPSHDDLSKEFARRVDPHTYNMATLQEILVATKLNPEKAVSLLSEAKPSSMRHIYSETATNNS